MNERFGEDRDRVLDAADLANQPLEVEVDDPAQSIDMIAAEYDDMAPYFNDLAARFMEQNPDVEVEVQVDRGDGFGPSVRCYVAAASGRVVEVQRDRD